MFITGHFPLNKQKRPRNEEHKAWITKGFRNSMKNKNELLFCCCCKKAVNETNYRRYRNTLTRPIKIAERYYHEKEFVQHRNDRKRWQIIR